MIETRKSGLTAILERLKSSLSDDRKKLKSMKNLLTNYFKKIMASSFSNHNLSFKFFFMLSIY